MEDIVNVDVAEIEVTPEMIKRGASVLYRMTTHIADEEYWAEEIYTAMASLRPRPHGGHRISREVLSL